METDLKRTDYYTKIKVSKLESYLVVTIWKINLILFYVNVENSTNLYVINSFWIMFTVWFVSYHCVCQLYVMEMPLLSIKT